MPKSRSSTPATGPAASYLAMVRHNTRLITEALRRQP